MSDEARKNLIALSIAGAVVAAFAGFVLWPSLLTGVHRGPLAESVASVSSNGEGRPGYPNADRCRERDDGVYECEVAVGGASDAVGRKYVVEASGSGCWDAEAISRRNPDISGCVRLWDVFLAD